MVNTLLDEHPTYWQTTHLKEQEDRLDCSWLTIKFRGRQSNRKLCRLMSTQYRNDGPDRFSEPRESNDQCWF